MNGLLNWIDGFQRKPSHDHCCTRSGIRLQISFAATPNHRPFSAYPAMWSTKLRRPVLISQPIPSFLKVSGFPEKKAVEKAGQSTLLLRHSTALVAAAKHLLDWLCLKNGRSCKQRILQNSSHTIQKLAGQMGIVDRQMKYRSYSCQRPAFRHGTPVLFLSFSTIL